MLLPRHLLAQLSPDTDAVAEAVPEGLTMTDWLQAGLIVLASFAIVFIVRRVVRRTMRRIPGAADQLASRLASVLIVVIGLIYALSSIGIEVGLFLGALGIGGVVLAFAFQDILENFVAGVILQAKRPFRPGDYVELSSDRLFGIVQVIDSRSVIIHTFGGDRIIVPAAEVLGNPIVNWTVRGRHRLAVDIGIHYRTTPSEAIAAITPRLEAIDEVLATPAPRVLLSELGESSVNLTAYVWHDAFGDIFWIRHRVIEEAKAALDDAGIEIPFPQRVLSFAPDPDANVISVRDGRSADRG